MSYEKYVGLARAFSGKIILLNRYNIYYYNIINFIRKIYKF